MGKKKDERRNHPRLSAELPIELRFHDLYSFLTEYSVNISAGGMFIKIANPPAQGTIIHFKLLLDDGTRIIEGTAEVMWNNRELAQGKVSAIPGMGIRFMDIDEESLEIIKQIVETKGRTT